MRRRRFGRVLFGLVSLSWVSHSYAAHAQTPSAEVEIAREGIRLHDQGQYEVAIAVYKRGLRDYEESSLLLSEMATSYSAMGDYGGCIDAAKKGLKKPGRFVAHLFAAKGICESSSDLPRKALRSFKKGLEVEPDNLKLLFNIAVTLQHEKRIEEAIAYLQKAIEIRPSYSSPYLALSLIHQEARATVKSLFYCLRFIMLEPDSARSQTSAARFLHLFRLGVEQTSESEITLTISSKITEEDPISFLEFARTLAATVPMVNDEGATSEAAKTVLALTSFVAMVRDPGENQASLDDSFFGRNCVAPFLELTEHDLLEPFAYWVAFRAGEEGAQEWISEHQERVASLGEYLQASAR